MNATLNMKKKQDFDYAKEGARVDVSETFSADQL